MNIRELFRFEQASGILMIGAMVLALAAANSPLAPLYQLVHHAPVHVRLGPLIVEGPLVRWINQGLMALFFLVVGLEIKRQLLEGHLSGAGRAALPVLAAFGGMAAPAATYILLTWGEPELLRGWAIPTATDIVLALGILALLGRRVPVSLRVFLTALAVFDDIGAVLIIALFYGHGIAPGALLIAGLAVIGLAVANRLAWTHPLPYTALGAVLWIAMSKGGIEPALAGVIIGAAVPLRAKGSGCRSPLRETERRLHPYTALLIVPAFAFFNAGIGFRGFSLEAAPSCAALGVALGLFLGKPLGIMGMTWAAIRLRVAELPRDVHWPQLGGAALLGGIGFTMSLFVASLAFADPDVAAAAKLAILAGSMASAISGVLVLAMTSGGSSAGPKRYEAVIQPGRLSRDDVARRFDALAPSWDRKHGPSGLRRFVLPLRTAYLRGICEDFEQPRVLDVGCGTGQQLIALADRIGEGVGIDISPAMVQRARANARARQHDGRLRFEVLAGEDACPGQLGKFDLIMCTAALEHMADPQAVLARMAELLRPGGAIVLVMAHPWHPRSLYNCVARRIHLIPPFRHFAWRRVCRRMKAVGLRSPNTTGISRHAPQRLLAWLVLTVLGSYFAVFTTEAAGPARAFVPSLVDRSIARLARSGAFAAGVGSIVLVAQAVCTSLGAVR